jgi:hypothetical protein
MAQESRWSAEQRLICADMANCLNDSSPTTARMFAMQLNRRTGDAAIGTEYAAIAGFWF